MKKKKLLLVLFVLFFSPLILAQEDSTKTEEDWKWHWQWGEWEDWTIDWGFKKNKPAISLQYGLAELKRDDVASQFVNPALVELKLGYIRDKYVWNTDYIINHSYKYIYLSNESNKLAGKERKVAAEIETDMWRFGFGKLSGYGYKIGECAAIIPYHGYTVNWTRVKLDYPYLQPFFQGSDYKTLNRYNESFRFGTSNEAGIRIKPIENLILDAAYERSIVFERHLFWKWAGSAILETAAQGLIDGFINEVFESSPAAGPIVNFLLKNGLAYGLYELRQEKMNWPFNSEAPLSYDQFKFGVTVVF
ncbi:MAG: hypothetical protein WAU11_07615 [Ignavibacteriaceae bacterium]